MSMPRVMVNGASETLAGCPETLGDLLDDLDRRCHTRGEVVTAVRCDDVDEPAFREAPFSQRSPAGIRLLEVEAAKPGALLLSSLDQARLAVEPLGATAQRLGEVFRRGDTAAAKQQLTEFAQGLVSLVTLTNTVSMVVAAASSKGGGKHTAVSDLIDDLSGHVASLIAAQRSEDWITVADVIQYEIGGTLRGWPSTLSSLRDLVADVFLVD